MTMQDPDFDSPFGKRPAPRPAQTRSGPPPRPEAPMERIPRPRTGPVPAPASPPLPPPPVEMWPPQRIAAEHYGVTLDAPVGAEELFVGVARNPNQRSEEEEYWPLFSTTSRRRQHQIFTFVVEVPDSAGNPAQHVPVEVRGQSISGVLPTNGTPVAVYGVRDRRDGVVRTHKVLNVLTRSTLTVTTRKDVCFIATAVYGSIDAPEVVLLRHFRDRQLMPVWWGRAWVHLYYAASPGLAHWIAADPARRRIMRAVLDNLVCRLARRLS